VQNKKAWPTQTADNADTALVKDLSFVHAAFSAALKAAPASARLALNDYNTGGNDAKTACMFTVLADVNATAGVPYTRLAVAFQSHVTGSPDKFASKAALTANFKKLAALGASGLITELDVKLSSNSSANERYQAAIFGDYLDVGAAFSARARPAHALCRPACMRPTAGNSSAGTRVTTCHGLAPLPQARSSTRRATQRCENPRHVDLRPAHEGDYSPPRTRSLPVCSATPLAPPRCARRRSGAASVRRQLALRVPVALATTLSCNDQIHWSRRQTCTKVR
jgi:hypothetical protein